MTESAEKAILNPVLGLVSLRERRLDYWLRTKLVLRHTDPDGCHPERQRRISSDGEMLRSAQHDNARHLQRPSPSMPVIFAVAVY